MTSNDQGGIDAAEREIVAHKGIDFHVAPLFHNMIEANTVGINIGQVGRCRELIFQLVFKETTFLLVP